MWPAAAIFLFYNKSLAKQEECHYAVSTVIMRIRVLKRELPVGCIMRSFMICTPLKVLG
jgi:hypothetical protein